MKRIEVKLSLEVVAPLLDVIRGAAETLADRPAAVHALDEIDPALREEWREELLAGQKSDLDQLLALFGAEFFEEGVIFLDEENAEALVRACAAVRLRLRLNELEPISDETLEAGEVEIENLPETLQKAFMSYVFLATLQELIIQHLDSAILDGEREA